MKKIFYIFAIVAITLTSCDKSETSIGNTSISNKAASEKSKIPFSDDKTLANIALNKDYVSYQTARKLALVEMEVSIKDQMKWFGAKLSAKPVLIYDGKSNPKYYEFIVSNEAGTEIGTITTCVQKETDAVISHVLPYVRDYSFITTKGGDYKMISGGYPTRILVGVLGKSGDDPSVVIDPATNKLVTNLLGEDAQSSIKAINSLSNEQKTSFGITNTDSLINVIIEKDAENREYAKNYWCLMDSISKVLNPMTDQDVANSVNSSKDSWTSTDEYVIPRFNRANLKNTFWNGWCGPSALAWIYRGLYDSYNGTYLPLAGETSFYNSDGRFNSGSIGYYSFSSNGDDDNDKRQNDLDKDWVETSSSKIDGGLYANLANIGGMYLWPWISGNQNGPTLPFGLSASLASATNLRYFVGSAFIMPGVLEGGHTHIRNRGLPVICLVDNFSHYVVAFGSKLQNWNWDVYFKKWGIKFVLTSGSIRTNKWLYVTDNGYTISNSNYNPYWRNDSFLSLDLQYPVCQLY